jgi:hypothetical protein
MVFYNVSTLIHLYFLQSVTVWSSTMSVPWCTFNSYSQSQYGLLQCLYPDTSLLPSQSQYGLLQWQYPDAPLIPTVSHSMVFYNVSTLIHLYFLQSVTVWSSTMSVPWYIFTSYSQSQYGLLQCQYPDTSLIPTVSHSRVFYNVSTLIPL